MTRSGTVRVPRRTGICAVGRISSFISRTLWRYSSRKRIALMPPQVEPTQPRGTGDRVDGDDFLVWQRQSGITAAAATAVPEPASMMMEVLALAGITWLAYGKLPTKLVCAP